MAKDYDGVTILQEISLFKPYDKEEEARLEKLRKKHIKANGIKHYGASQTEYKQIKGK